VRINSFKGSNQERDCNDLAVEICAIQESDGWVRQKAEGNSQTYRGGFKFSFTEDVNWPSRQRESEGLKYKKDVRRWKGEIE
jgi:hypothetical protein